MAEEAALLSDDDMDLELLDEEELEHRRELAAVISNMKSQLSHYASEKREQDIKGLESLVCDVLDDVAAADGLKRVRTDSMPAARPNEACGARAGAGRSTGRVDTRTAITNLLGETDPEDLTDHEHEEDGSMYENRSGLGEDMKFLASMPELCGQSLSCPPMTHIPPSSACITSFGLLFYYLPELF